MWKIINASVIGTSHINHQQICQDYCLAKQVLLNKRNYLIALVSDGAGSAKKSDIGAKFSCEIAFRCIQRSLKTVQNRSLTKLDVKEWIDIVQKSLNQLAKRKGFRIRDFACTLMGTVISKDWALFFQIGDGAMVASISNQWEVIFWPDMGTYANTTYFITETSALSHLHIKTIENPVEEVALFSDGLQRLVLSFVDKKAHAPFFNSLFNTLRTQTACCYKELNKSLEQYLSSKIINDRTDDDKTLVLATKRKDERIL